MTYTLRSLYLADQADRLRGLEYFRKNRVAIKKRDAQRMKKLRALLKTKKLKSGRDFLYAAMLFQHGTSIEDYAMAYMLAMQSYKLRYRHKKDEPSPLWLAAATRDRWLVNLGLSQDFGTQFKVKKDLSLECYPVNPKITNKERKKWDVPPI